MLGFTPVESLVLVLVRGGVLDCLMRADLAEAMRADGPERLADLVARNSAMVWWRSWCLLRGRAARCVGRSSGLWWVTGRRR